MPDSERYDLQMTVGERFDRVFSWLNAIDRSPLPMAGFTGIMIVYGGGDQLLTSAGTDPDISLQQEPGGATGQLWLSVGAGTLDELFVPYGMDTQYYSYRLDLVDNALDDNIIPLAHGYWVLNRKWGS